MTGVTELNDNLYVVLRGSNTVRVFGNPPLYNRLKYFVIAKMEDPSDLVSDLAACHLYIADRLGRCVWSVEVKSQHYSEDKEVKVGIWAVIKGKPMSLSIARTGQFTQVLVVDWQDELTICGSQGERSTVTNMKDSNLTVTRHVIQTSNKTFIVLHKDCVSLIDQNWNFLKKYGGPAAPLRLSIPERLTEIGDAGQTILVDEKRILVLSPCLEVERTLILRPPSSEDTGFGWGRRLCYSRSSGRLVVSWGDKDVWIYSVT